MLVRASQRDNRKLREVAHQIVARATGQAEASNHLLTRRPGAGQARPIVCPDSRRS